MLIRNTGMRNGVDGGGRISTLAQRYQNLFWLVCIICLSVASLISIARADNMNPGLYSTSSSPHNLPYQKWLAGQWQWKFAVPKAENPLHDYSAQKCGIGQKGPVWFLDELLSGTEIRECSIPAGKSIFLPILNGECDLSDTRLKNDQDLIQCAAAGNEYSVISAQIDGVPIKNLNSYRTHTFFNLTVPPDNVFDEKPPGIYRAYADATALFMMPFAPGQHDVHYTVVITNPVQPSYNYAADVTYHLTVKP